MKDYYSFEEFKKMIEESDNVEDLVMVEEIYQECNIENRLELSGMLSAKLSDYGLL